MATTKELRDRLSTVRQASEKGKADGARIRVRYARASDPDEVGTYTGRLDALWNAKSGDSILTMTCEERDGAWRSLNLDKGSLEDFEVLEP